MSEHYSLSSLNKINRHPERAAYDRDAVYAIIDKATICHCAISEESSPVIIPIIHGRIGDRIFLHGAVASRLQRAIAEGSNVCLSFTVVDALVLAKSIFHHSMNYRSVVAFGKGGILTSSEEKMEALKAISEHLLPGRWDEVRGVAPAELQATSVVYIDITSASAKSRSGKPIENSNDEALPIWSGILPISQQYGTPVPADEFSALAPLPRSIQTAR